MSAVTDNNGNSTRTFTPDEVGIVIRALLAVRPHVNEDERKLIERIIQDGWHA